MMKFGKIKSEMKPNSAGKKNDVISLLVKWGVLVKLEKNMLLKF
jgi:hypothetical protein